VSPWPSARPGPEAHATTGCGAKHHDRVGFDHGCHALPLRGRFRHESVGGEKYGPPEGLQLAEVARPVPDADQVLLKVLAASVNAATRPSEETPFWWGISTSAYQFEEPAAQSTSAPSDSKDVTANLSFQTDWDLSYQAGKIKTPRDDRVASYSHAERDISALKQLGVTHYRFGVEWARVEPKPGQFDEQAIAHYVQLARKRFGEQVIVSSEFSDQLALRLLR